MPELPEVEVARRQLERWMKDRQVIRARSAPTRAFRGARRAAFDRISGKLERIERKGKYLLWTFEAERGLLSHLGMTGKFVRRPAGVREPYSRARFELDDGSTIHFRDPRMFGRMEPVAASQLWELPVIRSLGPDALNDPLGPGELQAALGRTRQPLKVALMDQSRIAGLGNIHAAEALYRARLHPARVPGSLHSGEWKRLARGIHATLDYAFEQEDGTEEISYVEEPGAPNPFLIYGRAGERCRRCKTVVRSFVQGGRTTHFCQTCQPGGTR